MHVGDAVTAALAVARRYGVRCADPVVLHNGSNVLVHLRPAPVVARVASLTALIRPGVAAWVRRDIEVSAYLAGVGVGVAPPCTDPPAGPHHHDGLVLAFFSYIAHDPAYTPTAAEVGRMLGELHEALRDYPGELPADGPVSDLGRGFDVLEREGVLPVRELDRLRAELAVLAEAIEGMPAQGLFRGSSCEVLGRPTEPQGTVTAPSHNPPDNRTVRWDATTALKSGEAD